MGLSRSNFKLRGGFGMTQAVPYCWTLLYVPMHFLTVELLLFMTGVWTTNIHDCIHGRCTGFPGTAAHQA